MAIDVQAVIASLKEGFMEAFDIVEAQLATGELDILAAVSPSYGKAAAVTGGYMDTDYRSMPKKVSTSPAISAEDLAILRELESDG